MYEWAWLTRPWQGNPVCLSLIYISSKDMIGVPHFSMVIKHLTAFFFPDYQDKRSDTYQHSDMFIIGAGFPGNSPNFWNNDILTITVVLVFSTTLWSGIIGLSVQAFFYTLCRWSLVQVRLNNHPALLYHLFLVTTFCFAKSDHSRQVRSSPEMWTRAVRQWPADCLVSSGKINHSVHLKMEGSILFQWTDYE